MKIININSSRVTLTSGHCPEAATVKRHKLSHMPARGALVLLPGMVLMKCWDTLRSHMFSWGSAGATPLLPVHAVSWGKPMVFPCHVVGTAGTPVLSQVSSARKLMAQDQ